VLRDENNLLLFLISKNKSVFKINLLSWTNKLLLLNSNDPMSLLKNFVLSKFILPLVISR